MPHRWRKLGSEVSTPEEILQRSEALAYQLEAKRKQCEVRQLVLLELEHLAAFLLHEAASKMPEALYLRGEVSLLTSQFKDCHLGVALDNARSPQHWPCGPVLGAGLSMACVRIAPQIITCPAHLIK